MIYPTELTLTTGTTVYAGDPESDERIRSREVRVSVTYRIDDEKADVPLLAGVKAAELERVHRAAWERLGVSADTKQVDTNEGTNHEEPGSGFDAAGLEEYDPGPEPPDGTSPAPDPFPEEADYLSTRCGPASGGAYLRNGNRGRNGVTASPAGPERGTEAYHVTEAETDWATKPQVLALGSHFKRLGLSPQDQTALLRARFGKFRAERLTKDEAAELMRCLERGELERGEWEPAEMAATR